MSDEAHIESAYLHRDGSRFAPWHGLSPDEAAMLAEEGEGEIARRADVQEALFCYLFSGGAEQWLGVALRVLGVLRRMWPDFLVGRRLPGDVVDAVAAYSSPGGGGHQRFDLGGLEQLVNGDVETVRRLMGFCFPDGRDWLKEGCRRLYLLARAFQPHLVVVDGREASYEVLARIFGEVDFAHSRARGRWSARAQICLARPISKAGGKVPAMFGKGHAVKLKYREAAKGNRNRSRGGESPGKAGGMGQAGAAEQSLSVGATE